MRNFKSLVLLQILGIFLGLFATQKEAGAVIQFNGKYEVVDSGSLIVDMGVTPVTVGNALKPYGMIYELLNNYNVYVNWSILPGKGVGGIDFSHNGKDYIGGPFIIPPEYRTPQVDSVIAEWMSEGVEIDTAVSDFTAYIFGSIVYWPIATLDQQSSSIAIDYYQNADIPSSAYNLKLPTQLDNCDDIFIMPHADPTWATHSNVRDWDRDNKGYFWASCRAVSIMEGINAPGDTSLRMNFLSTNGLQCYDNNKCGSLITEDHPDNPTLPYTFDSSLADDPLTQFLGDPTSATENGSEEWYIPLTNGRWRPTTTVMYGTSDGAAPRQGAKFVFGRAFGNPNYGLVFYLAGHNPTGTNQSQIAAQASLFNFLMTAAIEKGMTLSTSFPVQIGAGSENQAEVVVSTGGRPPFTYQWETTCNGVDFSNPNDSLSNVVGADTLGNVIRCTTTVTVTDFCGNEAFEQYTYLIAPIADTICFNSGIDTFHINAVPGATSYNWTIPTGALQVGGTAADTFIVINWNGVDTGLHNICVSAVNSCGEGPQLCNSYLVEFCNNPPVAVNDTRSTPEETPILINVLANDTDPDNNIDSSTVMPITNANNGTAVTSGFQILYSPDLDFNGTDSFQYSICDLGIPIYCDTATVFVTVTPVNDTPCLRYVVDTCDRNENGETDTTIVTIPEDTDTTVCFIIEDPDFNNPYDSVVITVLDSFDNGMGYFTVPGSIGITMNDTLCVFYRPDTNWTGQDTFVFTACDTGGLCDTQVYIVIVTPVNDPPVANDDFYTTLEDNTILNVIENDFDVDGPLDSASVTIISGPSFGTAIPLGDGTVDYNSILDYNGNDTFVYFVCDTGIPVLCDTATVFIEITPVNDTPKICLLDTCDPHVEPGVTDTLIVTIPEDSDTTVCFIINDVDFNNPFDSVTYFVYDSFDNGNGFFTGPAPYSFTMQDTACVFYEPDTNYIGTDTFVFIACDTGGLCDTQVLIVIITPVNDPPLAVDDFDTVVAGDSVYVSVLDNDSDLDGDTLTVIYVSTPNNGVATIDSNNLVKYVPNITFSGIDTFQYAITDSNGGFDTANVYITVLQSLIVNFDSACIDDNPLLRWNIFVTGTTDTLATIYIIDTAGDTTVLANQSLNNVVFWPGFSVDSNGIKTYPGPEYRPIVVYASVNPTSSPDTVAYPPATPFCAALNQPPVANDDFDTVDVNDSTLIIILANDFDPEGFLDTTSVVIISGPSNGTANLDTTNGEVLYTPNLNFVGFDTFTYYVCDQFMPAECDTADVFIAVIQINDCPIAVDDFDTTREDITVNIDVLANDIDVDSNLNPESVEVLMLPANGTATATDSGTINYTPNLNFFGFDTFSYIVCDTVIPPVIGTQCCDTATVYVVITPENDPPCIGDTCPTCDTCGPGGGPNGIIDTLIVTIPEDSNVTACFPITDVDFGNPYDSVVIAVLDSFDNGMGYFTTPGPIGITMNDTPCVYYQPDLNWIGRDVFVFTACDTGGLCDTQVYIVDVTPVNDPPCIGDTCPTCDTCGPGGGPNGRSDTLIVVIPEDTDTTSCFPITDVDFGNPYDSVVITVLDSFDNGMGYFTTPGPIGITMNDTFCVFYQPDSNWTGIDTFVFTACDTGGLCDTQVYIVIVTPVNDCPMAMDDYDTTREDTAVVIDVLANDVDVDFNIDPSSVAIVMMPANGTAIPTGSGTVTYTPDPNFNGNDTFRYVVCDTVGQMMAGSSCCDTASVFVTVLPVNDPPCIGDTCPTCDTCGPGGGPNGRSDTLIVTIPEDTDITTCFPITDVDFGNPYDSVVIAVLDSFDNGQGYFTQPGPISFTMNDTACVYYEPDTNWTGTDTFVFIACDTGGKCDTQVYIVIVTPVNDCPIANNDFAVTNEDSAVAIDVLANDVDADDTVRFYNFVTNPSNGTVSIDTNDIVTYTPDPNWYGVDSFYYSISDDACEDTALVIVLVLPVNDTPDINVDEVTVCNDTCSLIFPLRNDIDNIDTGQVVDSIGSITQPSNGTATLINDSTILYCPNPGFYGSDVFFYTAFDNGDPRLGDIAAIAVLVDTCNRPPVVVDTPQFNPIDTIYDTTYINTPITPCPMVIDPDGDNVDITGIVIAPSNGTVTGLGTGDTCFTYTPDSGFIGNDTMVLIACDDGLPVLCDTFTVIITVIPRLGPVAIDDSFGIANCDTADFNVISNDFHLSQDSFYVSGIGIAPVYGTASVDSSGNITYVADSLFLGTDSFFYVITDIYGSTDTGKVIVTVFYDGCGPTVIANDDFYEMVETQIRLDARVDTNDIWPTSLTPTFTVITDVVNGFLTFDETTGEFSYEPVGGPLMDSFQYVLCVEFGGDTICDTAWAVINLQQPVVIPTGFSPNGDGANDFLVILNLPENYPDAEIFVFNRWGDEVWNSQGPYNNDWEGVNRQGNPLPDGTYYMRVNFNVDGVAPYGTYLVINR